MNTQNILDLNDTLSVFEKGYYIKTGKKHTVILSKSEREETKVILPETKLQKAEPPLLSSPLITVSNQDSFDASYTFQNPDSIPLVLNLGSAMKPGGGVRNGANAQEESLCRTSSLLFSLESNKAEEFYRYNRKFKTKMYTDAAILSPKVEVIKQGGGIYRDKAWIVSVLTMAAPNLKNGMEGMTDEEYLKLLDHRIHRMLEIISAYRYKNLVLGAFGCGVFGNDARTVAESFYRNINEFQCFTEIHFAVLDNTPSQYNYKSFKNTFSKDRS